MPPVPQFAAFPGANNLSTVAGDAAGFAQGMIEQGQRQRQNAMQQALLGIQQRQADALAGEREEIGQWRQQQAAAQADAQRRADALEQAQTGDVPRMQQYLKTLRPDLPDTALPSTYQELEKAIDRETQVRSARANSLALIGIRGYDAREHAMDAAVNAARDMTNAARGELASVRRNALGQIEDPAGYATAVNNLHDAMNHEAQVHAMQLRAIGMAPDSSLQRLQTRTGHQAPPGAGATPPASGTTPPATPAPTTTTSADAASPPPAVTQPTAGPKTANPYRQQPQVAPAATGTP